MNGQATASNSSASLQSLRPTSGVQAASGLRYKTCTVSDAFVAFVAATAGASAAEHSAHTSVLPLSLFSLALQ